MRPFLGITCSSDEHGRPVVRPAYVAAVHRAGGLPVALPFIATTEEAHALLDRLHGIVFTGSEDLDPAYWDEARDVWVLEATRYEVSVAAHAEDPGVSASFDVSP